MVKADLTRDYYSDLELQPGADVNEIKKQFKKLALKYHPDRNIGHEGEVNAKFQKIQSAHEVLTDPEQRAKYDASRKTRPFSSTFTSAGRGNPYANAGSQWAPPPRRAPTAANPPPPSAGARRYRQFDPGASPNKAAQEGAESRRNNFQAWENMRAHTQAGAGPGKTWATPKAPPREFTPQSGREESNNMKHTSPPKARPGFDEFRSGSAPRPPNRSQSTHAPKKAGFMPSDPDGDEPQAGSTSAYFTRRSRRSQVSDPQDPPEPPPRGSPPSVRNIDPLRQFREKADVPYEPRLSTPYATHGGEKTDPFEAANLSRSKSTRDRPNRSNPNLSPFSPGGSSDRHRSASPSRSHRHHTNSSSDNVPRTDSDPNLAAHAYTPNLKSSAKASTARARYTPNVELDNSSSDEVNPDIKSGPARTRARGLRNPRRTAVPSGSRQEQRMPDATAGIDTTRKPSLAEFREWWALNGYPSDPSHGGQDHPSTTNGDPTTYAKSQNVNDSKHHKTPNISIMFPTVSEAFTSKNDPLFVKKDEDLYGLTASKINTKWPNMFPSLDGKSHTTTLSGAATQTQCLNAFEAAQRSLIDKLLKKQHVENSSVNHGALPSAAARKTSSQTCSQSPDFLLNYGGPSPLEQFKSQGCRSPEMEGPFKKLNLMDQFHSPKTYCHISHSWLSPDASVVAGEPVRKGVWNADRTYETSFSFDINGRGFENPPIKPFASNSAENISTKFTPEDWHRKFEAGDYFMNEQKAAGMPPRGRSGSRARGRSPIKSRQPSRPQVSTQVPLSDVDPKTMQPNSEKATPTESPGGTRQFSAEEWAQTFKPQTFAPPPHPSPGPRPAYTSRSSTRKQRGSIRPTMGTAAVVDDDDSSDEKPLFFVGRKSMSSQATAGSSNGSRSGPPTGTESPNAMDLDTPEEQPPPMPSTPTATVRQNGFTTFTKAAAEAQARNVPVEPSRPEWRAGNNTSLKDRPLQQPDLPPRAHVASPLKRRTTKSTDSDDFKVNFEDLKNAEPLKQSAAGLNSFEDLAGNLPFESKASATVPIAKSPKTGNLNLPKPPKAPSVPMPLNAAMRTSPASWKAYLDAFKAYMVDWDLFNTRMIAHFVARKSQVDRMKDGWLDAIGDDACKTYCEGCQEDQKVREWWTKAADMHDASMKDFIAVRDRMKDDRGIRSGKSDH